MDLVEPVIGFLDSVVACTYRGLIHVAFSLQCVSLLLRVSYAIALLRWLELRCESLI